MEDEKNSARSYIGNVPIYCAYDEIVQIESLKPNPRNPNSHPDSQVKLLSEVIKRTGWRANITVSTLSGFIVKGHGRLLAAKLAGFEACPVEYQDFKDEEEELSALLADNKLAELAEIDTSKLAELFKEFEISDLDLTGYSQNEYNDLLGELESANITTSEDDVEELREKSFTQLGDIWLLGKHKLICGDATKIETYKTLLGNETVDLVVTDPPYNVNYEGGTADKLTIKNDNMEDEEFREFLRSAFSCMSEVMKDGASFYIWHSDSERYNFQGACQDIGLAVRQCIIWIKNTFVIGRQDYQWKHEPCLYGWKSGAAHYFVDDRTLTTCFEFDKPLRNDIHPTMKPVELFKFQIGNSSRDGDIVLDGFAGSGTTLIACESSNRLARLIELDERYCDAIVKRFISANPNAEVICIRDNKQIEWKFEE